MTPGDKNSCEPCASEALVTTRRSEWVIAAPRDASPVVALAARELRDFIERITATELPLVETARDGAPVLQLMVDDALPEQGFRIQVEPRRVEVRGNGAGVLYGVYALLE